MFVLKNTVMEKGQEPVGVKEIINGCGIENVSGLDWNRTAWLALERAKTLGFLTTYRSGRNKYYAVKDDEELDELKAELVQDYYFTLLAERVCEGMDEQGNRP
jgi:hypothetical protein